MSGGADQIGPNAVIQTLAALYDHNEGAAQFEAICAAAGLDAADRAPTTMIPDAQVAALYAAIADALGLDAVRAIGCDAGLRTADYVLANRIPGFAKALLRAVPARWATALLTRAIAAHAWTFTGAGAFSVIARDPLTIALEDNPVSRRLRSDAPVCGFYEAAFTRLYAKLADRRLVFQETECASSGGARCVFVASRRACR